MSTSREQRRGSTHPPETSAVYESVMEEAAALNVMDATESERRRAFYEDHGIVRTKLRRIPYFLYGHVGYVKDETLHPTCSYKIRGAANAVARAYQSNPMLARVSIGSAGNAAQGVLEVARQYGLQTTAYVPENASSVKVARLETLGAQVAYRPSLEDCFAAAALDEEQGDSKAISPFDQLEYIAGNATVGYEVLEDMLARQSNNEIDLHAEPVNIFLPVGGGGLISGVASVIRWAKEMGHVGENVQVFGVQMENCNAMYRSRAYLDRRETPPAELFRNDTFNDKADGIAVRTPGKFTVQLATNRNLVADIVCVSEGQLGEAMTLLSKTHGRKVEPAGALAMAGARAYAVAHSVYGSQTKIEKQHLVTVTSGANVSDELYDYFMDKAQEDTQSKELQNRRKLAAYRAHLLALGSAKNESSTQTAYRATSIKDERIRSPLNVWRGPTG